MRTGRSGSSRQRQVDRFTSVEGHAGRQTTHNSGAGNRQIVRAADYFVVGDRHRVVNALADLSDGLGRAGDHQRDPAGDRQLTSQLLGSPIAVGDRDHKRVGDLIGAHRYIDDQIGRVAAVTRQEDRARQGCPTGRQTAHG